MRKQFLLWDNPKDAMLTLVGILMLLGGVNIFSASFVVADAMFNNGYHYLFRYIMLGIVGLICMFIIGWKIDYHKFLAKKHWIFLGVFFLLLAVDVFGKATKGAQRWLMIGSFSFQPSEFVKLAVLILGAGYLGHLVDKGLRPHLFKSKVNLAFIEAVILTLMVAIQPDVGTAGIIMGLMIILYIIAGLPIKEVVILGGAGLVVVTGAIIKAPYRLNRVLIWLNPWADPQGNGYQAVQSFVSIGSGGWFGTAFGMGTGKFFFLPEAHTDFAFAIFCQEWGFFGAIGLMLLFLMLAAAIYRIGQQTTDKSGFLLVTGANFFVVGQAIANMAMVCGLLPVIGVPLSFISYGGTSLIATLAAIGLVISVYRSEIKKAKDAELAKPAFLRNNRVRPSSFSSGRWR
jgi:cell division protein FtsW